MRCYVATNENLAGSLPLELTVELDLASQVVVVCYWCSGRFFGVVYLLKMSIVPVYDVTDRKSNYSFDLGIWDQL